MLGAIGLAAGPHPGSCDTLRRLEPVTTAMIEGGFMSAGRAAVRASGASLHDLARKNTVQFDPLVMAMERQAGP